VVAVEVTTKVEVIVIITVKVAAVTRVAEAIALVGEEVMTVTRPVAVVMTVAPVVVEDIVVEDLEEVVKEEGMPGHNQMREV